MLMMMMTEMDGHRDGEFYKTPPNPLTPMAMAPAVNADTDDDNDGVVDTADAFPLDSSDDDGCPPMALYRR